MCIIAFILRFTNLANASNYSAAFWYLRYTGCLIIEMTLLIQLSEFKRLKDGSRSNKTSKSKSKSTKTNTRDDTSPSHSV